MTPEEVAARLRAAARVRRPGMVPIVAIDDGATTATAADWPRFEGVVDAQGLRVLAGAVADLHGAGVSHGAIGRDSLVADPAGQPALPLPAVAGEPGACEDDVAALGRLVPPGAPDALAALVARMTDRDPARRPTASQVVAELTRSIHPRVLARPRHRAGRVPIPTRRPLVALGAIAAGVVAIGLAMTGAVSSRPRTTPVRRESPPPRTTTTTPRVPIPSTVPASTDRHVVLDGRRYVVGAAGDLVVVGDWRCDGTTTVAVVRLETGEVFLFGAPGDGVTATHAADVPGAVAAGRGRGRDGCDVLVVDGADRSTRMIVNLGAGEPRPRSSTGGPPP